LSTTLESIARGVHIQLYPAQSDEPPIDYEVILEAAKSHYAYRVWEMNRLEVNSIGENNIPTSLLTIGTLNVDDNGVADISKLKALTSLPSNSWIQSLGGVECGDCEYDIMDLNKWKLLCKDKSRRIGNKAVIVIGNTMRFVEGLFGEDRNVEIVYANLGGNADKYAEIDQAIGDMVRNHLLNVFGKRFPFDKTNNSNPDK
jgi:hypothetical protein